MLLFIFNNSADEGYMEPKVFISHAKEDQAKAIQICDFLESQGIPCWISHRDILAGVDWSKAIMEGIRGANVLLLIFTSSANDSPHILREVQIALEKGLKLIPLRLDNIEPSEGLGYFISAPQWLEAYPDPLENYLPKLSKTINKLIRPTDQVKRTVPVEKKSELADSPIRGGDTLAGTRKFSLRVTISAFIIFIASLDSLLAIINDIKANDVLVGLLNILGLSIKIVLLVALFLSTNVQVRDYKFIRIFTYLTMAFCLFAIGVSGLSSIDYKNIGALLLYGFILYLHRKDPQF